MKGKKILATILSAVLVLAALGVPVLAEDATQVWNGAAGTTVKVGTAYYNTLAEALKAVYQSAPTGVVTIECKKDANVGAMTHSHVADDIIIEGNGARVSGGECDLELDTYRYSRATGAQAADGSYLTKDVTVKVNNLNGIAAWGERHTDNAVTLEFTGCKEMNRVYFSGKAGTTNIKLKNCSFTGTSPTAVYANNGGTLDVDSCSFSNVSLAINMNNKSDATRSISVKNTTFTDCATQNSTQSGWEKFSAPIRVLVTGGGETDAKIDQCTFTYSESQTSIGNGDILLGDGRAGESYTPNVNLEVTNTAAEIQKQVPGKPDKTVKQTVTKEETVTVELPAEAKIGTKKYSTFRAALDAAKAGDTIDLMGNTVELHGQFVNDTIIIEKDLTFTNGTFDLSNVSVIGNGLFESRSANLTFDKINMMNKENTQYKSAFGVIFMNITTETGGTELKLTDCNFTLRNEGFVGGGVIKGLTTDYVTCIIKRCTFDLTNPERVFTNITLDMEDSKIDAVINDQGSVNHGLRNVVGSIKRSDVTIDGFANGLKQDDNKHLTIMDGTNLTLVNSRGEGEGELHEEGYDLMLKGKASLNIDKTSAVDADTRYDGTEDNGGIFLEGEDGDYGKPENPLYALTFELNGGVMDQKKVMLEANVATDLSAYKPTKEGLVFSGWYSDKDLTKRVSSITMTGNTTVYANWRKPMIGSAATTRYTVTFESNGGSKVADRKVVKKTAVAEPPAPTKEGFTFTGWYTDPACTTKYDFAQKVTKAFKLYAGWEAVVVDQTAKQLVLTIGQTGAAVFGETMQNDVAPKIVHDRTMLPARFVAENLGAKVEWDGENRRVLINGKHLETNEDVAIVITIDSDIATVNGVEVKLDAAAFIENDRTYTPIRFIAEELGASVEWVGAEMKVVITKP